MGLVREIYNVTREFPSDEKFGLVAQMRKAAISIPSNIAEGQMRGTDPEFARFPGFALGSTGELVTQLILSKNLGYVDRDRAEDLDSKADRVGRIIRGLKKSVRGTKCE